MPKCTPFSRNHFVSSILTLIFSGILIFTYSSKANANTIIVPPGGDIQAAINLAQFGDTIILQAGATYETPFDYTPFNLVNKNGSSFFQALHGAHHFRLSGLWITNKQGSTTTQLLSINGQDITHQDPRDPLVDWP